MHLRPGTIKAAARPRRRSVMPLRSRSSLLQEDESRAQALQDRPQQHCIRTYLDSSQRPARKLDVNRTRPRRLRLKLSILRNCPHGADIATYSKARLADPKALEAAESGRMGVTNRAGSAPNPADQEAPKAESKVTE